MKVPVIDERSALAAGDFCTGIAETRFGVRPDHSLDGRLVHGICPVSRSATHIPNST